MAVALRMGDTKYNNNLNTNLLYLVVSSLIAIVLNSVFIIRKHSSISQRLWLIFYNDFFSYYRKPQFIVNFFRKRYPAFTDLLAFK